jgi:hypothetical protein
MALYRASPGQCVTRCVRPHFVLQGGVWCVGKVFKHDCGKVRDATGNALSRTQEQNSVGRASALCYVAAS